MASPEKIAIDRDDYHAEHVGTLSDGRQFFVTTPFVPAGHGPGREFIAVYLFDADGKLLEARIDDLGTRATLDDAAAKKQLQARLAELGEVNHQRIEVRPFQLERFGVTFGLIPQPPEEEDEEWCVILEPGNYMAFYEPFDSGEYDT
jgi:hypothetical protein